MSTRKNTNTSDKEEDGDDSRIPIEGEMYDIVQFRGEDLLAAMTEEN